MNRIYATTSLEISQREITNLSRSRRIAAERMVLLKNNGILPMELKGRKIALFGNGARHTVPGGTGSGEVNARNVCSVEQGLEHAGACIMTKAWLDRYDAVAERDRKAYMQEMKQKYASTPELAFWAMFAHRNPLTVPVEENDFARGDGDMAIYILARNSGEGSDRRDAAGDYQMQQDEKDFLSVLCRHYGHVIVVLNVGGVIDTAFLRDQPEIDAILLMGRAGMHWRMFSAEKYHPADIWLPHGRCDMRIIPMPVLLDTGTETEMMNITRKVSMWDTGGLIPLGKLRRIPLDMGCLTPLFPLKP